MQANISPNSPPNTPNTSTTHDLAIEINNVLINVGTADMSTDQGVETLHDYFTLLREATGREDELDAYGAMDDQGKREILEIFQSNFNNAQATKIAEYEPDDSSWFQSVKAAPGNAWAWAGSKTSGALNKFNRLSKRNRIFMGIGALAVGFVTLQLLKSGPDSIPMDGPIDISADGFDGIVGIDSNGDGTTDFNITVGDNNELVVSGDADNGFDGNVGIDSNGDGAADARLSADKDGEISLVGADGQEISIDGDDPAGAEANPEGTVVSDGGSADKESDTGNATANGVDSETAELLEKVQISVESQFKVEPGSSITREIMQLYESNGVEIDGDEAYKIFLELKDEVGARNIIDLADTDGVRNDVYRFMTDDGVNDVRISDSGIAEWTGDTQKFFEADLSDRLDIDMSSTTADAIDPSQTTDTSATDTPTPTATSAETPDPSADMYRDQVEAANNDATAAPSQTAPLETDATTSSSAGYPSADMYRDQVEAANNDATAAPSQTPPLETESTATATEKIEFEDKVRIVQAGDTWSDVIKNMGVESDKSNEILLEKLGPWLEGQGLATESEAGVWEVANNVGKLSDEQLSHIAEEAKSIKIATNYS